MHEPVAHSRRIFIRNGVALASLATTIPAFIQESAFGLVQQASANPGQAGIPGNGSWWWCRWAAAMTA